MLYCILCTDVENSHPLRKAARPAHLQRLEALQSQGRLVLAGPFPAIDSNEPGKAGFTGSLIIAEFTDLAAAQDWAGQDPYIAARVYASTEVKPFKQVFPN